MATKPASLAVITFDGFHSFLLPVDRALKVAALMEGAVTVELDFTSRNFARDEWLAKGEVQVAYKTVKADAVKHPNGDRPTAPSGRRRRAAGVSEGGDQ